MTEVVRWGGHDEGWLFVKLSSSSGQWRISPEVLLGNYFRCWDRIVGFAPGFSGEIDVRMFGAIVFCKGSLGGYVLGCTE